MIYPTKQVITAGTTGAPIMLASFPATVTAVPGGGGTLTIQYSTSPPADVASGSATWQPWPYGAVSAVKTDALVSPVTAVRGVAATADGVLEVVQ